MMAALPLMMPAVASLPALAITTAPVVSFEAILADVAPQPEIADCVAPIEVGGDQLRLDTLGIPAADDTCTPEQVSVVGQEVDQCPVVEAIDVLSTPELMVAAQVIAVAAQLVSSCAKPTTARELPQQNSISVGPKKIDVPVRATSANVIPAITKLLNEREPTETIAREIEAVAQQVSSLPTNQRPNVEPAAAFNLPTIAAPTNIQPQIFHELDLARDLAWIGNLAQDIVAASSDPEHLSFRLMPRSLGQLDVDLSRSPEGLHVEMTANTERATQIIAAEQPRLIEELRQSGIKIASADLATGQHPGSGRGHQPPRAELPFFDTPTRSDKPANRPDGRFA